MHKHTVTLCMIVKDEELLLDRCLSSVRDVVDEIVIVDTGSTDRTIDIARSHGARVLVQEWKKDFAWARNSSIEAASSDFILVLDADEYLDEQFNLANYLREEKDFYFIHIKNHMSNEYVSYHQAIRLFKNNRGLSYYGKIHEHLNIEEVEGLTGMETDLVIHHTGYQKEAYLDKDKMQRNFEILEKETLRNPTGYNYFNLGMQFKVAQDFEKALDNFKKSYYLSKDQVYLSYLLYQMGDCLLHLSRYENGIHFVLDAIQLFPKYTGYYFLLGNLYEEIGYLKDAENCYKKCLEIGEVKDFQTIEGVGTYLANIKLSIVLQKQGKLIHALEPAFTAIQQKKYFVPGIAQYIQVLLSSNLSKSDIIANLDSVYPIKDIKDLSTITGILYNKRSGLLIHFIQKYNISLDENIQAVALQYSQRYKEASEIWRGIKEIKNENYEDIIANSIVTGDKSLLSRLTLSPLLNSNEIKVVEYWLNRDKVVSCISKTFSETFIDVLTLVLKVVEESELDYFYNVDNIQFRHKFLSLLIEQGKLEKSIQLIQNETNVKESKEFLHLLGQLCVRTNRLNDAVAILNLLYETDKTYETHLALYNFYEKLGGNDGIALITQEMKSLFPLSFKL